MYVCYPRNYLGASKLGQGPPISVSYIAGKHRRPPSDEVIRLILLRKMADFEVTEDQVMVIAGFKVTEDTLRGIAACALLFFGFILGPMVVLMMHMVLLGTPDLVLGITACAASVALFILYPIPTDMRIKREKTTGGLQPYPYCFTRMACFVSFVYGASWPKIISAPAFMNILLVFPNIFFTVVQTYYWGSFRRYTTERNKGIMGWIALPELILFLYLVCHLFGFSPALLQNPHNTGSAAATVGIIMYASPIPSIIHSYRTRTTNYLPFGLCTMYFLNAFAWFAYAYLYSPTYDFYLAIAHGGGVILEIIQLFVSCILMVIFRSSGTSMPAIQDSTVPEDSTADLEAALPLLHYSD